MFKSASTLRTVIGNAVSSVHSMMPNGAAGNLTNGGSSPVRTFSGNRLGFDNARPLSSRATFSQRVRRESLLFPILSTSSDFSCHGVCAEHFPQRADRTANMGFDATQRNAGVFDDFGVGHSPEKCNRQDLALHRQQLFHVCV